MTLKRWKATQITVMVMVVVVVLILKRNSASHWHRKNRKREMSMSPGTQFTTTGMCQFFMCADPLLADRPASMAVKLKARLMNQQALTLMTPSG